MKRFVGCVAVGMLGLVGCSSEISTAGSGGSGGGSDGGSGGGGECFAPTEKLPLSVSACGQADPGMGAMGSFDGVVTAIDGGVRITGTGEPAETIDVTGVAIAIPDGTFVTAEYLCAAGFYGEPGETVMLTNVPTLDAAPNPTEAGTRLWYFGATGGESFFPEDFPFTFDSAETCRTGDSGGEPLSGFRAPLAILLSGDGFDVRVEPGQSADFAATGGAQAGAYSVRNINATWIGFPGGDASSDLNVDVVRSD